MWTARHRLLEVVKLARRLQYQDIGLLGSVGVTYHTILGHEHSHVSREDMIVAVPLL
jgi:hypothetical protein